MLHQAALGSVPRSLEDPLTTHAANNTGFLNMLVATRDAADGLARQLCDSGHELSQPSGDRFVQEMMLRRASSSVVNG